MDKSKINVKQVIEEIKAPALIFVGMLGGSLGGKALDKALKVDPSLAGFNPKAMAKPVALLSSGIAGALLLKDQNLKLVAAGVAASGIASGVKVLLKKDLLSGFDGLGDANQLLIAEAFDTNLPELSSGDYQALEVEYPSEESNYDEYEEVQDVEIL